MANRLTITKFEVENFPASRTDELKPSTVSGPNPDCAPARSPVPYSAGGPRARDAEPVADVHHGDGRRSRRRRQHVSAAPGTVALGRRRLIRGEGEALLRRRLHRVRDRHRSGRGSWSQKNERICLTSSIPKARSVRLPCARVSGRDPPDDRADRVKRGSSQGLLSRR